MGNFRCWCTCRDCGERQMVSNRTLARRSRPKCMGCGGTLDRSDDALDDLAERRDERSDRKFRKQKG